MQLFYGINGCHVCSWNSYALTAECKVLLTVAVSSLVSVISSMSQLMQLLCVVNSSIYPVATCNSHRLHEITSVCICIMHPLPSVGTVLPRSTMLTFKKKSYCNDQCFASCYIQKLQTSLIFATLSDFYHHRALSMSLAQSAFR